MRAMEMRITESPDKSHYEISIWRLPVEGISLLMWKGEDTYTDGRTAFADVRTAMESLDADEKPRFGTLNCCCSEHAVGASICYSCPVHGEEAEGFEGGDEWNSSSN